LRYVRVYLVYVFQASSSLNSYNESQRNAHFTNLFDKVLYMFRTRPLSIIRSISTLCTRNRCCHSSSVGIC